MNWYWYLVIGIGVNWPGYFILCWIYSGWLWLISRDTSLRGWVYIYGGFPTAIFQLKSQYSWFGAIWKNFYGHGLFGSVIYRGSTDVQAEGETIVHELRHVKQQLWLGLLTNVLYVVAAIFCGYRWNIFEADAFREADKWIKSGKPKLEIKQ